MQLLLPPCGVVALSLPPPLGWCSFPPSSWGVLLPPPFLWMVVCSPLLPLLLGGSPVLLSSTPLVGGVLLPPPSLLPWGGGGGAFPPPSLVRWCIPHPPVACGASPSSSSFGWWCVLPCGWCCFSLLILLGGAALPRLLDYVTVDVGFSLIYRSVQ